MGAHTWLPNHWALPRSGNTAVVECGLSRVCVNVATTDTSSLGAYTEAAELAVKRANAAAESASKATEQLQEHVVRDIL
eukprot:COSAG02_NODE_1534_length_12054_cov_22.784442_9_plen_79_part_00